MSNTFIQASFFDLGDTLVNNSHSWLTGAKTTLDRLRQKSIRLGIISNTGNLARPSILNLLPADFDLGIFEANLVIFSSEVNVQKPQPQIFQLAIERAGLESNKCLFCTEDLLDTLVAQQVGMRTARLLKPPSGDVGDLESKLAAAGLIPV